MCIGDGWIAVVTDQRIVRIFSLGGIQREILSVAGPVVSISGHTHQLLLTYHHAMGETFIITLAIRL